MNPQWFGDSYDIVKRFFVEALNEMGYTVYIDPMFTGGANEIRDIQDEFLEFIGVQMMPDNPPNEGYSAILVDPDKGVRDKNSKEHVKIKDFADLTNTYQIVFAFDQSFSRAIDDIEQMEAKLRPLHELGVVGFYYDSHAKFVFGSRSRTIIESLKDHLMKKGLPAIRIFEIKS